MSDLFVESWGAGAPVVLAVQPGRPPTIILSASLMQLGPAALRFPPSFRRSISQAA